MRNTNLAQQTALVNTENAKKETVVKDFIPKFDEFVKELPQNFKSVDQKGFFTTWASKLLFTIISIKTWGLIASMAVTTWLLVQPQPGLTGTQWMTFNTTIWTMLYGINEVKKAYKRNDKKKVQEQVASSS